MRITDHPLSINTSDKGGKGGLRLEVGETERFDGDLDLVGPGERGVGSSHGSVAMGVLGVPDVINLEAPSTGTPLDSTANKHFASCGNFEVVFEDLGVLADDAYPALTLIDGQGYILEENGVDGELRVLGDETGTDTQSANAGGIFVSNDPQLSISRHSSNLFDELSFVSVEEMVEHNVVGEFLGKSRRRGKVPCENEALTRRELLDEDFTGGEGPESGSEFPQAE